MNHDGILRNRQNEVVTVPGAAPILLVPPYFVHVSVLSRHVERIYEIGRYLENRCWKRLGQGW